MGADAFDVTIRALECQKCAAPIEAPSSGGSVRCGYCGTINVVSMRRSDAPDRVPSLADEVARLSRLAAQRQHPVSGHAYDMSRPPAGVSASAPITVLQERWLAIRAQSTAAPQAQRDVCWLALLLAERYTAQRQDTEARAALETGLDLLADAGHRHLLRCRLAEAAVAVQELDSARGWLAECDPAPEVLELDSTWRSARGRLLLAGGDFAGLLDVVGRSEAEVPIHPHQQRSLARMRVHALEKLGELPAARQALEALLALDESQLTVLVTERLAPATVAEWRRALVRRREESARQQQEATLADLRQQRRMVGGVGAALRGALLRAPVWATALLLLLFLPTCADLDPTLGAVGYVLCPAACETCTGPSRVVTRWTSVGPGEWTTNGPEYFCSAPETDVAHLPAAALEARRRELRPYALGMSVHALLWLVLLLLVTPLALLGGVMRWVSARRRSADLDRGIAAAARELGIEPPIDRIPLGAALSGSAFALAWYGGGVLLMALIIAAELVLW